MDRSRPQCQIETTESPRNDNEMYQTGKYSIVEILEAETPLPEERAIITKPTKLPGINKNKKSGKFSQTGKSSSEQQIIRSSVHSVKKPGATLAT